MNIELCGLLIISLLVILVLQDYLSCIFDSYSVYVRHIYFGLPCVYSLHSKYQHNDNAIYHQRACPPVDNTLQNLHLLVALQTLFCSAKE
jgi:hypothetical protein